MDVRGRSVDARLVASLGPITLGEEDCSSEDVVPLTLGSPDNLRVPFDMVEASGVWAFSLLPTVAFSAGAGAAGTRLLLFEIALSFAFFAFSFSAAESLLSLCITSARAFPIEEKLRALIEARVLGRVRWGSPPRLSSVVDIVVRV